ncbi:hypothetical protein CS022_13385 [Veronia nyctiphanis]|uniref:N-acetyltransferase domain-containing protein n=1 Tax=Veronia nyctiphanis TaxID=1278244 RepID=A0A4Q0YPF5_9GAMM|nr:GNAT family N-acetyltransferase [Veronia nyctiphanis]RXJ72842.1 hypothetical protein CS022_13385 [Veronia nyctiphanis]
MNITLRDFRDSDGDLLENILIENDQFEFPDVENKASMKRVADNPSSVFLVAEWDGKVAGFAKGFYDGSRAQLQLVSVAKQYQRFGVGKTLIQAVQSNLKKMGAPTVAVVNREETAEYWLKSGYSPLPVNVMVKRI